jgi:hypothetical protein
MAYTLTYSGGTITVSDGTLNTTSTSISLPGRNYAGYGSPVDQNMVSMLENFASSSTGPSVPFKGQFWYDVATGVVKYNTGTQSSPTWATVVSIGSSPTFGNVTVNGDIDAVNITASGDTTTVNLFVVDVVASGDISAVNVTASNDVNAIDVIASGNVSAVDVNASGNVSGVNFTSTGYYIHNTTTGISAAGTTQGTATLLTSEINVVSTVPANSGVKLPVTTGGMRLTIVNSSATAVNVYPNTSASINSGSANAAYTLDAGSRLDYVSVSATKWYTLNATYS